MKTSTQLKALLRNLSKNKGINAEILLRNFMLERLLERIKLHKQNLNDELLNEAFIKTAKNRGTFDNIKNNSLLFRINDISNSCNKSTS